MTVLGQQETTVVGGGTVKLPRVNLLPPEIAEKRAFFKLQVVMGAVVVGSVVLVGLLYAQAASSVSSAQAGLSDANNKGVSLQGQVAKYSDVTAQFDRAAAAQAQLTTAMGDEVRFSQLLNDLSLTVPNNVWLKNLTLTTGGTATAAGTPGTTGIGSLSATAVAFSHDDVAVWLEAIAGLKTYVNPYFTNSTEGLLGKRKIVNFTSTATVTGAALSNRYTKPAGG